MIYYVVEVRTKYRGHDREYLETSRENFSDVIEHLKHLCYLPFEIQSIRVKQYAYSEFCEIRTALLNCFNVFFPGNNMIYDPIFEFEDVSYCV